MDFIHIRSKKANEGTFHFNTLCKKLTENTHQLENRNNSSGVQNSILSVVHSVSLYTKEEPKKSTN